MKIDYVDGDEYWTVETIRDLRGWRIIEVEDWKEGVKRLHVVADNPPTFRLFYCRDEILEAELQRQRDEFNRQAGAILRRRAGELPC